MVYKLHPGETADWRSRLPWLAASPLDVVGHQQSIYELFAYASAQLGVYSTALFEGVAFGLRTYVATLPGHEALDVLVARGYARRVSRENLIEQVSTGGAPALDEGLRAELWKPAARENFRAVLRGVLDCSG